MDIRLIIFLIIWGILGSLFLLFVHRLVAQAFPQPSSAVFRSAFQVQLPPSEEEGDGMAAVYALDAVLMNAELDRPGSTFWLYYRQPGAVITRWVGSLLISFLITFWVLGLGRLTCGGTLLLLVGLGLSAYPYQTWWMSRPTLKEK
jgi:hypothetical protein